MGVLWRSCFCYQVWSCWMHVRRQAAEAAERNDSRYHGACGCLWLTSFVTIALLHFNRVLTMPIALTRPSNDDQDYWMWLVNAGIFGISAAAGLVAVAACLNCWAFVRSPLTLAVGGMCVLYVLNGLMYGLGLAVTKCFPDNSPFAHYPAFVTGSIALLSLVFVAVCTICWWSAYKRQREQQLLTRETPLLSEDDTQTV